MDQLEILDLSNVDYPGIPSTVIYTHGCNLACPYCYNVSLVSPVIPFELDKELMDRFVQNLKFVEGVVITGGEPLLHPNITNLITFLKDVGYKVKLDTNGTLPDRLLSVLGEVDYVAMDIKSDIDGYYDLNINVDAINQSIRHIKQYAKDYEFRSTCFHPFISRNNAHKIGRWVGANDKIKRYYLQHGITNKPLLSEYKYTACDDAELEEIKNIMQPYVAEEVKIR